MKSASMSNGIAVPAISLPRVQEHKQYVLYTSLFLAAIALLSVFVYPLFLMKILCFAMFAVSFNLLFGYGGLMSFGHAAFWGMASYVSAYTAKAMGGYPEIAILLGTLAGSALGLVIGALAVRRRGISFAMITLALAQLVYFFCAQAKFTGGEDGIQSVPRGNLLGFIPLADDRVLFWFVFVLFALTLLVSYRVVHSPFGQILKSIRDNEPRAASLGFETTRYKLALFVISAGIASLAGATKAIVFQYATLTDVHWTMSGEPVLMTLIGGLGTIFGPVVGAAFVVALMKYLAGFGSWVMVIQGLIFIASVVLFRQGIVGFIQRWTGRRL
ncbi:branched-chain amino acid ABC transporter permease [Ottowia thiooxydans]|uniref:Branched-chain amino acid transport system permease protein n=1 Tax=Ottowia thiooxydans TaxID=219182 RepID=A0ABV2QAR3_9BURK